MAPYRWMVVQYYISYVSEDDSVLGSLWVWITIYTHLVKNILDIIYIRTVRIYENDMFQLGLDQVSLN